MSTDTPPTFGPNLAKALAAAQGDLTQITKGRTANAGTYSYSFADIGDVITSVRPVLAAHALFFVQNVVTDGREIDTYTTLGHESGETVTFGPVSFSGGSTPQTAGSAITYARRYALLAALGIATEDDDGQKAADQSSAPMRTRGQRPEPQPEPPPQPKTPAQVLYDAVVAVKGTPKAEALKALAAENNRQLKATAFAEDPTWAELVAAELASAA